MNIFKQLWDNFTNLNDSKNTVPVAPTELVMYNDMYPYTVEQTIRVTHHSKPLRRNAARRWNKIKNCRF
jgi:hypothetical protein